MLGFGARNQDGRTDVEFPAVKLLLPGYVLNGFAREPLMQITAIVDPPDLPQLFIGVSIQPCPVAMDRVGKQHLRREPGRRNSGFLEQFRSLLESRANGHAASVCVFSFSVW